jgi:DNA invertase Pin-like site-specific DNA recombinase
MSQEIGYARVSKTEQHLALQLDALKKRGVVRVFTDKQTGVRFDRKAFLAVIEYLNEGDTLVVWKLDRLGRSLQQLIETLERLKQRNIHLVSLTEDVNTSTPTGMLFFQLIAMLAEFEHNSLSERTKAGLEAARASGRTGGRPKLKTDAIKKAITKQLHASNSTNRVSGHSHLCMSRMELEVIFTLRRNHSSIRKGKRESKPWSITEVASQTKQVVSARGFNPLQASVEDMAQLPAPDAPWHQSSGIGLPAKMRGPTHAGLSRQSSRQWHGMARDVPNCARLAARTMPHQKLR